MKKKRPIISGEMTPANAKDIILSVVNTYSRSMEVSGISYDIDNFVCHEYIYLDRQGMREVLRCMLNQALECTPAGGSVHFTMEEATNDMKGYSVFRLIVETSAEGMEVENTLVKKQVEAMYGIVEERTQQDGGSRCSILVPFRLATDTEVRAYEIKEGYPKGKIVRFLRGMFCKWA